MKKQTTYNAVALNPNIARLLSEIVTQRVQDGSFVDNRVKVVADLIIKTHKKEVK